MQPRADRRPIFRKFSFADDDMFGHVARSPSAFSPGGITLLTLVSSRFSWAVSLASSVPPWRGFYHQAIKTTLRVHATPRIQPSISAVLRSLGSSSGIKN